MLNQTSRLTDKQRRTIWNKWSMVCISLGP